MISEKISQYMIGIVEFFYTHNINKIEKRLVSWKPVFLYFDGLFTYKVLVWVTKIIDKYRRAYFVSRVLYYWFIMSTNNWFAKVKRRGLGG